jgi:hypothetical protein
MPGQQSCEKSLHLSIRSSITSRDSEGWTLKGAAGGWLPTRLRLVRRLSEMKMEENLFEWFKEFKKYGKKLLENIRI